LTLGLIKQAKFLICDSSGKFQNDLDDQDLMLATVCGFKKDRKTGRKTAPGIRNDTSDISEQCL
jgi:hypothetical protein